MRARAVADNQHLVHICLQRLGDQVRELVQPCLQLSGIGPFQLRRMRVVMHQIVGKQPVIELSKPMHQDVSSPPSGQQPRPPGKRVQNRKYSPGDRQPCRKLQQQHRNGVQGGNDRPLSQPHQPPERTGCNVNPRCTRQLQVGRGDRLGHAVAHDIRPNQHLDLGLDQSAILLRGHMPAIRPLARLGADIDLIARDFGLYPCLFTIKLAIAARMNRIIAGNVKHPAFAYLRMGLLTAHDPALCRAD